MCTMAAAGQSRILVKDLNSVITCRLCEGYLVDATTLIDCFHVFCRACILRHFENNKTVCPIPICSTSYKKKSQPCFRPDPQIQSLVYKLVPGLYAREQQRREDFYRSTGVRASSSCSDDSVIERERQDMISNHEDLPSNYIGDKSQFFSPEDSISLSLEYYQSHLDTTDVDDKKSAIENRLNPVIANVCKDTDNEKNKTGENSEKDDASERCNYDCDRRYLRCPAAVSMKHLQKFVRMKFGLTVDHRVDIIYRGEVLPKKFSLMDVAYTFKWKRVKPMRFFYRIFIPMKIRPIKIVNTTLSTGGKQLQIVPVKPNLESPRVAKVVEKKEVKEDTPIYERTEDQKNDKEVLFAHLQLQSKSHAEKETKRVTIPEGECIFVFHEDQEEIKKFAEKRDREWALQKKLDEKKREDVDGEFTAHHGSKKRKKSKHSKSEFNLFKKRKLHAEIASNEEELKLKVKITNNSHKHKHHKNSAHSERSPTSSELSSKEKLLQMRQVRHKQVSIEDKNMQTVPAIKISKDTNKSVENVLSTIMEKSLVADSQKVTENGENSRPCKAPEDIKKLKIKVPESPSKVSESAAMPKQQVEIINTSPKIGALVDGRNSKLEVKNPEKNKKIETANLELSNITEKDALKTFRQTLQTHNEERQKAEKHVKVDKPKVLNNNINPIKLQGDVKSNNPIKSLERKIINLQEQFIIQPKQTEMAGKKVTFASEKRTATPPQPHYPPGFTVSKIEQGLKRKADEGDSLQDKRPSLEITLINPPLPQKGNEKPVAKRPPPATIPLERIKKSSISLKSCISIIPKLPDMCDNIGALDLSKTSKSPESSPKVDPPNGISVTPKVSPSPEKNVALSNLQMLSKVATEHPTLSKSSPPTSTMISKPRPQIPNLQTLRMPMSQISLQSKVANLQKLPKLNEIQKFRPTNAQIRNIRPNQNQNIRNIPNPSLLIRLQNQNRMNPQINSTNSSEGESKPGAAVSTSCTSSVSTLSAQKDAGTVGTTSTVKCVMDCAVQEKGNITV